MGKNEIIIFCLIIQILKIVQRQLFLTINNIQQEILITFLHLYYLSNNDHELLENLKKISLSLEDTSMGNYEIQKEVAIKKKKLSELFNFKLAKSLYKNSSLGDTQKAFQLFVTSIIIIWIWITIKAKIFSFFDSIDSIM